MTDTSKIVPVLTAALGGAATLGVAGLTGFLNLSVESTRSQGTIDLEQVKYANTLVDRALELENERDRATSLLFYAEVGLLQGLNTEKIAKYAALEQDRIDQDKTDTPSFLPAALGAKNRIQLTDDMILSLAPDAPPEVAEMFGGIGNFILAGFGISDNPLRLAHFLALVTYETGGFRFLEEIASGEAYEGRGDLGNTRPGDGKRYKGRGMILMTGRANYERISEATGIDLVSLPEQASDPAVALLVAAAFWNRVELNTLADQDDIRQITRRINGGFSGLERRSEYLTRAKEVLGITK